jgi:serine/threonine-protein kinase RsbW
MGLPPSVTPDVSASFEIPSRAPAIDDARVWMSGYLRAAGASDDLVWECELALTEALSNVIRHAYKDDGEQRVELALRLDDEGLEIEILHHGEPFAPEAYREPDLEAAAPGGYGLYLMRQLMDEVEQIETPGSGTCLRLMKHR